MSIANYRTAIKDSAASIKITAGEFETHYLLNQFEIKGGIGSAWMEFPAQCMTKQIGMTIGIFSQTSLRSPHGY